MRPSALKHPVAILRKFIGLDQVTFADYIDHSAAVIQSVETLRTPLTSELAKKISKATGVDESWLIAGDPATVPRDRFGDPYSLVAWEAFRRLHMSALVPETHDISERKQIEIRGLCTRVGRCFSLLSALLNAEGEVDGGKLAKTVESSLLALCSQAKIPPPWQQSFEGFDEVESAAIAMASKVVSSHRDETAQRMMQEIETPPMARGPKTLQPPKAARARGKS